MNDNEEKTTKPLDNNNTQRAIVSIRGMDLEIWKEFRLMALEQNISMAKLFEAIYKKIKE